MAYEGNQLALGNMNPALQEMIEQGGLYENIEPLEATNAPADYPLGESFFANTSPNIASWQTALNVDATFARLFVITRVDKNRLHAFQDIIIASGTETKRFTRYNLNDVWLDARESGGSATQPYGIEVFNENHAIRRFPVFNGWENSTLPELLYIIFDTSLENVEGEFRLRFSIPRDANGESGQGESQSTVRMASSSTLVSSDWGLAKASDGFAKQIYVGNAISAIEAAPVNGRAAYSIIKVLKPKPIYIEIEMLTSNGKAKEVLESAFLQIRSGVYTLPWTLPPQKSVFEKARTALMENNSGITVTVSPSGDDLTGKWNDVNFPFKTVNAAVNSLPKFSSQPMNVNILAGTYEEIVVVSGFTGSGILTVRGGISLDDANNYKVRGMQITGCSARIDVTGIHCNNAGATGISASHCQWVMVNNCNLDVGSAGTGQHGVITYASIFYITTSNISNRNIAIQANYGSTVYSAYVTGSNNQIGLAANSVSTIGKYGTQPGGVTPEGTSQAGQIRS